MRLTSHQLQGWPSPIIFTASGNSSMIVTTDRTYYVSQTGDNNDDGLTPATAFATIAHAFSVIDALLVPSGVTITVQLEDGVIEIGDTCNPPVIDGNLIVKGDTADLSAVTVSMDGTLTAFSVLKGQRMHLEGFNIGSVAAGGIVLYIEDGNITFGNIRFGSNLASVVTMRRGGASVAFLGTINFTANFTRFASMQGQGMLDVVNRIFAFTGSLAITEFITLSAGYVRADGTTRTGTNPTGKQYSVNQNGVLFLNGATLPGATAGTTATGGQAV